MSNTQPLADYFIADLHLREINEENKLGSKGIVTNAFAELIKFHFFYIKITKFFREMWSTQDKAVKPLELLGNLNKYAPQFTQGNQEDCQEFLIFLLDIIHEVFAI